MVDHQKKFSVVVDAYNSRLQLIVNFGKWLTTNKNRVTGWYHSMLTIGPAPKLIQISATFHTLCVTKGLLVTYKLFTHMFDGKPDEDFIQS